MNSPKAVLLLLGQWRELTLAEGLALRTGNWEAAGKCQAEKQELRRRLDSSVCQTSFDPEIHHAARELAGLESGNLELLAQQREARQQRHNQLHAICRNLHRLRQSYTPSAQTGWNSYS